MEIRTITYMDNPGNPASAEKMAAAGRHIGAIRSALKDAGYKVQSARFAAPPFPLSVGSADKVIAYAQSLEDACFVQQIDYASIGPARIGDGDAFFKAIPPALAETQNIFASAIIADPHAGISLPAARLAADVIHKCALLGDNGFGNLRFAALANVSAGAPFLPAAYHDGGAPMVTIGVEAASLAVEAVTGAATLAEARQRLVHAVNTEGQHIARIAQHAGNWRGIRFGGLDFSLAPFPEPGRSVGTALERLSGARVGEAGTLAAAAFLAEALDRAEFKRAGFSGLFLPVFEDSVLAARAAEGLLTPADLLLYSSVCGTGLDTIPLPGDTTPEALWAILVDLAALALRLNKQLTARLMPIPGKQAGDPIAFDFAYFAPTRVLAPHASGLGGLFAGAEAFEIRSRAK
jgi:uncharacterized protein